MDLPLIKYHIKELCGLMDQEPNNDFFVDLHKQLEALLNSSRLINIKEEQFLLCRLSVSEDKPLRTFLTRFRRILLILMKSLRQTPKQAI